MKSRGQTAVTCTMPQGQAIRVRTRLGRDHGIRIQKYGPGVIDRVTITPKLNEVFCSKPRAIENNKERSKLRGIHPER